MSDRDDMQDNDGGDGGGGRVRNDDPLGLRRRRAGKKRPPAKRAILPSISSPAITVLCRYTCQYINRRDIRNFSIE